VRCLAAVGSCLFATLASPADATAGCDAACLEQIAGVFLSALGERDPAKVPFAGNPRYSENGQQLRLGDGLWRTATAGPRKPLLFSEPAAGQVGFIGVIEELGLPVITATRLKVQERQIVEVESIVVRPRPGGRELPESLRAPDPLFRTPVAPAQRQTREELVRIADAYFTALERDDSARNVSFDDRCLRRDNGVVLAKSTDPKAPTMAKLGCREQLDTGFSAIVTAVRDRRYPLVDVERGLVFAIVCFDHRGNVARYTRPDGTQVDVPAMFRHPFTFEVAELFRIENGRIRQIEGIVFEAPYGMSTGWEEK